MANYARVTVIKMTDNKSFTTPAIALTEVTAAAKRVETAYGLRKNGVDAKDELKNAAIALDTILRKQGIYAATVSEGDDTIMHSGGWETTGDGGKQKKPIPDAQAAPVLEASPGGKIKVKTGKVVNARMYIFILVAGSSFPITNVNGLLKIPTGVQAYVLTSTKHSSIFNGIPILGKVTIGMVTINAAGMSDMSALSTCYNVPSEE